jgi:hypothetical protein
MTRAKSLLALGDIAAARLLLERAANAKDASAAFLLISRGAQAQLVVVLFRRRALIAPMPQLTRRRSPDARGMLARLLR